MTSLPTIPSYISGAQIEYFLCNGFTMYCDETGIELFNEDLWVSVLGNMLTVRREGIVENVFRGVSSLNDIEWKMLLHVMGVVRMEAYKEVGGELAGLLL